MKQAKRVAKNTGFLYARMILTVFISLYSTRLILSALGTDDFGIYAVVGGIISMLLFLNTAMTSASQRFMSFALGEHNYEKLKQIFNVSIVLHVIIGFLVVIVIEIAGYILFDSVLQIPVERTSAAKIIFQFMVISTFFTIISVPYDAIINAHENMFLVAILGVLEAILKLGIAFYITFTLHDQLIAYGLLMAIVSFIIMILKRVYCHYKYDEVVFNIRIYFNKPIFDEMKNFAGWSLLGISTSMISNYGQGIVLNKFFGPVVNASQGIANQISGQLGAFSVTLLKAINPVIAKNEGSGNRAQMLSATLIGSKVSFFILLFIYVPVLIEMPYLFGLWLGDIPPYAIVFCRLLLIRNLIEQLFIPLYSSIEAVGKIKGFQIASAILNILPLIIAAVMFSFGFPPRTIYYIFIVYAIFNAIITLYFAKLNCDLSIPFFMSQVLIRCYSVLFGTFAFASIPYFWEISGFLRLVFTILFSSISFLGFVWYLGLTNGEKEHVKRLVSN